MDENIIDVSNLPAHQVDPEHDGHIIEHEGMPERTETITVEDQRAAEQEARKKLREDFQEVETLLTRIAQDGEAVGLDVVKDAMSVIDYVRGYITRKLRSL